MQSSTCVQIMLATMNLRFILVLLCFIELIASCMAQGVSERTDIPTSNLDSTTTPGSVVPTPPPSPSLSPPEVPTWTVKTSNSTCVMLRGNFTFAVTYLTPSGNSVSDRVDIPKTATVSGSCGPYLNSLALQWSQGNLTFVFIKKPIYNAGVDTRNGSYSLTTIFGRINVMNSNDQNGARDGVNGSNSTPTPASSGQVFYIAVRQPGYMTTMLHNSYSCESYQSLDADRTGNVYLEMRSVQLEAFHDGPTGEFSPSQPCAKDTMSSVLTILGYSALAIIVAATLGYLAWKKFGRAGYTEI